MKAVPQNLEPMRHGNGQGTWIRHIQGREIWQNPKWIGDTPSNT